MRPTKSVEPDEYGLWVEAELDRHKAYVDFVLQLVERGALGWSSGSVGHLTRRNGKSITQWPIIEVSLTPTPAEPRTLGVEIIKSFSASYPELELLLPETERPSVVRSTKNEEDAPQENEIPEEGEETMAEEEANAIVPATPPDMDASVKAAIITMLEPYMKSAVAAALEPYSKVLDKTPINDAVIKIPMFNKKTGLGDNETKAFAF